MDQLYEYPECFMNVTCILNCAHTNVYEKPNFFYGVTKISLSWYETTNGMAMCVYSGHTLDEKAVRAQPLLLRPILVPIS